MTGAAAVNPERNYPALFLYVQNYGVRSAFGEIDRAWIEVYARALGRALAGPRR
jgi:hypothetical protein